VANNGGAKTGQISRVLRRILNRYARGNITIRQNLDRQHGARCRRPAALLIGLAQFLRKQR
jgi:hypothetical protein